MYTYLSVSHFQAPSPTITQIVGTLLHWITWFLRFHFRKGVIPLTYYIEILLEKSVSVTIIKSSLFNLKSDHKTSSTTLIALLAFLYYICVVHSLTLMFFLVSTTNSSLTWSPLFVFVRVLFQSRVARSPHQTHLFSSL